MMFGDIAAMIKEMMLYWDAQTANLRRGRFAVAPAIGVRYTYYMP
jgi:hypothetical protein